MRSPQDTGESADSPVRRRTRQTIIEAAIATWIRDRDATLGEIAALAETHRATLHRHFPRRDDLLDAAIRHSIAEIDSATEAAALAQGAPLAALRRLVAAYLAIGDRIRFLFEDLSVARHPAVAELAAAEGPVRDLIRRAQTAGTVDPSLPAAWIERTLWALVYAASEAADDGTLPAHDALRLLQHTIDNGIAPGTSPVRPRPNRLAP